jgi:hypothetical protein
VLQPILAFKFQGSSLLFNPLTAHYVFSKNFLKALVEHLGLAVHFNLYILIKVLKVLFL